MLLKRGTISSNQQDNVTAKHRCTALPVRKTDENGYLLATAGVIILVVATLLGSFAFVTSRDNRFEGNYAMGENLAQLAIASHYSAQERFYRFSNPIDGTALLPTMDIPFTFGLRPIAGTTFTTDVRGCEQCPLASASSTRAASAYIHVRIRSTGTRTPSDNIALLAGAAKRNLARAGFVDQNVGADCVGQPTRVRWGPEASACLNGAHIATLGFTDVQSGDLIFPVWETVLANVDAQAMFRYPQPERSDLTMMSTTLQMQDDGGTRHSILDIADTRTRQLQQSSTATIENMTVRGGVAATQFQVGLAINGGALDVTGLDGQTDPAMDIAGNITLDGSGSVMGISNVENGQTIVESNTVSTADIRTLTQDTIRLERSGVDVQVVTRNMNQDLSPAQQTTDANAQQIIVLGELDASGANTTVSGGVYANSMTTSGANARFERNPVTTTPAAYQWTVGGIDQIGSTPSRGIILEGGGFATPAGIQAVGDCIGSACPDNITDPPGGGFE